MLNPHMAIAIHHLRNIAEDPKHTNRGAAKTALDMCSKRDAQRERLGLPPIFGVALTARKNITTYPAVSR